MKFYITGDTHQDFCRFSVMKLSEKIGMIILGDAAVNWTLDKRDRAFKHSLHKKYPHIVWYLVRGNHEARPEDVEGMISEYDQEVMGTVWTEPGFPFIKYFKDGGEYIIEGHSVLVIGGAYSVDKYYRLRRGSIWHANEQLTQEEMDAIEKKVNGKSYDIVLTHTCPYSWQPTDLFLRGLDQSTVDNSMEHWFDRIQSEINWKVWLFGHYHSDRAELPGVQMFFISIEPLETVWHRWTSGEEIEWYLRKSPKFERLT